MMNQQINEQEQSLANNSPEKRAARRVRGWPLFGGLLLLLIMAGLFVFRWRVSEGTQVEATPLAEALSANEATKTVAHNALKLPLSVTLLDMDP